MTNANSEANNSVEKMSLHGLRMSDYVKVEPVLSLAQKSALAARLAAGFNASECSADDVAEAAAILRLIIWSSEPQVVESIAQAAATNPNTPHDLAWALANDDESAALPILAASFALSDGDLVAIIEGTESFSKMAAVAGRSIIPEGVSLSLAERGDENVVHLLLNNSNAEIPDAAFERMLDRYGEHKRIQESVIDRNAVSPPIRQRLLVLVDSELAEKLSLRHPEAEQAAVTPTHITPVGYLEELSDQDLDELISQLKADGAITAAFLVRKLCLGKFDFFCRALATLVGMTRQQIFSRIVESPSDNVAELWNKASLSPEWLLIAKAATSALIQIDLDYSKSDADLFRRNIVEKTHAILRAEKYKLSDSQRKFFRTL